MNPEDLHWLAGLVEGEGTFYVSRHNKPQRCYIYPSVEVSMTDRDVVERVAALVGREAVFKNPPSRKNAGWQPQWRVRLQGDEAAALMILLRPLMGQRRTAQIDTVLEEVDGAQRNRTSTA